MSLFFLYVSKHYLKNILIMLLGLSGLFTGIDLLLNAGSIPSFNLKILYSFYMWQESLNLLYPLAIVFAGIMTKIIFIKHNAIGSFYALGISRKRLFLPFFVIGFGIYFIFFGLNFTSFVNAKESAYIILKKKKLSDENKDMFFKYNDSFVYIKEMNPNIKTINDLSIFEIKEHKVLRVIEAKEAKFMEDKWIAKDIIIKEKISDNNGSFKLGIKKMATLETLKGYKPQILQSLYYDRVLNLNDMLEAKKLLEAQKISTQKIKADIYQKIVVPLFSIAVLMIIFFKMPFHARYMNISLVSAVSIGGTLIFWGLLFALHRVAQNSVIAPEIALIAPIILIFIYAFYQLSI
ncbi:MAG: LptF/LptG family permease, partial [Epsilonproteobacteria bacterium]|nr:LptF/LptG family permease [Campylobacterota bacterium]